MVVLVPTLLSVLLAAPTSSFDQELQRGDAALSAGNFAEAIAALEKALEHQPEDSRARILLARAISGQADSHPVETDDDWNEIEPAYRRAEDLLRSVSRQDDDNVAAWWQLGLVLNRLGQMEEAIATLYHASTIADDDTRAPVLLDLGDVLMLDRQYAMDNGNREQAATRLLEAESVVRRAVEVTSARQKRALYSLATVLKNRAEFDEALLHYRQLMLLDPADTAVHEAHLEAARDGRSFNVGIEFYQTIEEQEPALAAWYEGRLHELRGHVEYNVEENFTSSASDYAKAEELMRTSAARNPEYSPAAEWWIAMLRSYRGYASLRAEDLEQAEASFFAAIDRAEARGLNDVREHALQGLRQVTDMYWTLTGGEGAPREKYEDIARFAARVCVLNPQDVDAWNNYGFFAREAGHYEESYAAYRRALALAPDNARILNDTALILIYHLRRDLDRALEWLEKARELAKVELEGTRGSQRLVPEETYGDTLVNMIVLHDQRKEAEQAKAILAQLEEEMPDRREIRMWRRRLFPGEASEAPDDAVHGGAQGTAGDAESDSGAEKGAGTEESSGGEEAEGAGGADETTGGSGAGNDGGA